ncbi:DNA integrity scanning protein DisA nucleotide-binding domain protein [Desulfobacter vibrioformis]|uniref:DNA integrity scanning protein DisA nucleotide-binding domain protein n=1 Tax=Desulfobacter vibrioformis TaxID=34031 RepID=UPI001FDFE5D1|nr:DNA integrity scanning protein DisA nucleotide-binding domain protein [Desulfobacter vibrioformis]
MFSKLCIANILNGVSDGLRRYSNPSRVALLFAPGPDDPVQVFDPQDLLFGHETVLNEVFLVHGEHWRQHILSQIKGQPKGYLIPLENLGLSGLISFAGASSDFFYQIWFTEHHPDMCSIKPTEKWLEQAATLLAHDYTSCNPPINCSDYVLKNYALQAIADYMVDERNSHLGYDTKIQIPTLLDHILSISKTKEEGAWARGYLFFTDPVNIDAIDFLTMFQRNERPVISNIKHTRKLLVSVEGSNRKLVSDGNYVVGITIATAPEYAIVADFRGDHGFLRMGTQKVASFCDGNFYSTTRKNKLVELEELLLDSQLDIEAAGTLFGVVSGLIHKAGHSHYGSTMVIDLNDEPLVLSGHVLDPPLSLLDSDKYQLAAAFMRIDGAVQITPDAKIRGFGCLLDGQSVTWENMARGARYNSALRFSATTSKVIVIVVSADRPISIIFNGIELNGISRWKPVYQYMPEIFTLEQHLQGVQI